MIRNIKLLKKYWPFLAVLLFALAIALGLILRWENQYAIDDRDSQIKLSEEAQNELWGFFNKAQQLAPQKQTPSVSFLAVGDIMLSRNVAGKIKAANDPLLPFRMLDDIFESVDFSFGNLESPFSGKATFNPTGSMVFNAPRDNIKGLVENKFKILNIANNHALDQGIAGLEYTIKYLDENNIKHTGAGLTLNDAWAPAMIEQNGIKLCFVGVSYASINDNGKTINNYVARIEDFDRLKSNISYLESTCDFVVASMHAGTEYTAKPNQAQIDFAHAAIDYGADMVIGHHPHWMQEIEKYCPEVPSSPGEEKMPEAGVPQNSNRVLGWQGQMRLKCTNPKYIFYSLGNFIFDQMWSQETREGLALKIQISKSSVCHPDRPSASEGAEGSLNFPNLSSSSASPGMTCSDGLQGPKTPATLDLIELIPIIIDNYSTPRLADEAETKKILERIGQTETILK